MLLWLLITESLFSGTEMVGSEKGIVDAKELQSQAPPLADRAEREHNTANVSSDEQMLSATEGRGRRFVRGRVASNEGVHGRRHAGAWRGRGGSTSHSGGVSPLHAFHTHDQPTEQIDRAGSERSDCFYRTVSHSVTTDPDQGHHENGASVDNAEETAGLGAESLSAINEGTLAGIRIRG